MNIYKYLLPASLAATVHVALLWFLPAEDYIRVIAVPLKTEPPKTPDPIMEPPEEKDPKARAEPVKPLLGKPAPPELEEAPITKLPDRAVEMPIDTRPRKIADKQTDLPTTIGDINGVLNGIDTSRMHIFYPGDLDGAPRAKVQLPPEYPAAMRHDGMGGSVLVEFDVNAEGRVVRAEAIRYTNREFVEPAVRAVRKWQFEPGRRHNKAVPFRMTVPIEFGLENN